MTLIWYALSSSEEDEDPEDDLDESEGLLKIEALESELLLELVEKEQPCDKLAAIKRGSK